VRLRSTFATGRANGIVLGGVRDVLRGFLGMIAFASKDSFCVQPALGERIGASRLPYSRCLGWGLPPVS